MSKEKLSLTNLITTGVIVAIAGGCITMGVAYGQIYTNKAHIDKLDVAIVKISDMLEELKAKAATQDATIKRVSKVLEKLEEKH